MKHVEYYHSINRSSFLQFANALGKATGEIVRVNGNELIMPPSLATGRLEYYDLKTGCSIEIVDCVFHKNIRLRQIVTSGSDGYKVLFNIGDAPVQINGEKTEAVNMGSSMADSVFFTSFTTGADVQIECGQSLKLIALYFRHDWGLKCMLRDSIPARVSRLKQFANYQPMQFSTCMDLKSRACIEEIFLMKAPPGMLLRMLEGCAYKLMALFFHNLVEEDVAEKRIVSQDAMRIIQFKKQLEQKLYEPIPTVEEAAEKCLVSRTKFLRLFRELFEKSYGAFFIGRRISLAKDLLDQGLSVMDAGNEVGYINTSHFIKAFRKHYGFTPGNYQQQRKKH
jgi:AraC-like DNA-binding protein